MKFTADLDRVFADDLGEVIHPLEGVVRLLQAGRVHPEGEVVEGDVFDTFDLRGERYDAGRARRVNETLRRQTRPHTAERLTHIVGEPHVAEMKFVESIRSKCFRNAETQQLCPAKRQRIKSRNRGPTLSRGVGIV